MAARTGSTALVSIALAFALVSVCTCLTVRVSPKSDVLNEQERETVYSALQSMVDLRNEGGIQPEREYYAGRLFTRYIKLNLERGIVVRMTRWSKECSISMSPTDTTEGRELLEAFKQLLPTMRTNLMNKGSQWITVSNHTDWIDYYVNELVYLYDRKTEGPFQPINYTPYPPENQGGSSVTDCAVKPNMLLSDSAFNQLLPGDSLLSPDGKYELIIPKTPEFTQEICVAELVDIRDGKVLWDTNTYSSAQINCFLQLTSEGILELWSMEKRIWNSKSACPLGNKCALGAASLAVKDGEIKLYSSENDHLSVYWSSVPANQ